MLLRRWFYDPVWVVLTCCQLTPHLNSSVFMVMISAFKRWSIAEHCDSSKLDSVERKLHIYIPPLVLWWLPLCASRGGESRLPSQRRDGHQNTSQTCGINTGSTTAQRRISSLNQLVLSGRDLNWFSKSHLPVKPVRLWNWSIVPPE